MSEPIKNAYDFAIVFDITNGNPNGDPNADGAPRIDEDDSCGLVSDVSTKRKIRDFVLDMYQHGELPCVGEHKFDIQVVSETSLDTCQIDALNSLGGTSQTKINELKKDDPSLGSKLRKYVCDNYYDIRTFGGVMTHFAKQKISSQIKGPVQIELGKSLEPIMIQDMCITRKGASNEDLLDEKGQVAMGRHYFIPYGRYVQWGHIDTPPAEKTGFDEDDLNVLLDTIQIAFANDHSSMRGEMALKALVLYKHPGRLRRGQVDTIKDSLIIEKCPDVDYPTSSADYMPIEIDESKLPCGVSVERLV